MEQLYNFISTVGFKLMQEDKLAIYEAVGWIIASLPMEMAAETLRKYAVDIFTIIQSVQGTTPQHNQMIIGQPYLISSFRAHSMT
jgi:hypothetical protein